jgi:DNA-binding transcriptional ArsR family regulator
MVVHSRDLDLVFRALGDPTRRAMLRRLSRREHTVGELAEPFRMSLAAASKHVRTLEQAGLVRREIRGRTHFCQIDPRPLAEADEWLRSYERLWSKRLAALEALLRHPSRE